MVLMGLWPLMEPGEVGSPTTGAPLLLTSAEARLNFGYVFSASSPKEAVVLTTIWGGGFEGWQRREALDWA